MVVLTYLECHLWELVAGDMQNQLPVLRNRALRFLLLSGKHDRRKQAHAQQQYGDGTMHDAFHGCSV
jgi:hypothetical protein